MKMILRAAAAAALIAVAGALAGCGASGSDVAPEVDPLQTAQVGDVVYLGTYEQDGNPENGAEPIAWLVLAVEDDRVLLLSQQGLEYRMFNPWEKLSVGWAGSTMQQWLQGLFAKTAELDGYAKQVELLSAGEVAAYLPADERVCQPTPFAAAQMADADADWWLRTQAAGGQSFRLITASGADGAARVDAYALVRPSMWVQR